MFSTDFNFRQQENLVDNQKCQAGFRPLCNKILLLLCVVRFNVNKTLLKVSDSVFPVREIWEMCYQLVGIVKNIYIE